MRRGIPTARPDQSVWVIAFWAWVVAAGVCFGLAIFGLNPPLYDGLGVVFSILVFLAYRRSR